MFEYCKKGFGFTVGCVIGLVATYFTAKLVSENIKQNKISRED